jgi:hypothetical protein
VNRDWVCRGATAEDADGALLVVSD